jgi:hypothetical protein
MLEAFYDKLEVFIPLNYTIFYMSWSSLVRCGIIILMNTFKKSLRIMRFVLAFLLRK